MASSPTINDVATKDPLDALLARLMAAAPAGKGDGGENNGAPVKVSKVGLTRGDSHSEEHDPWKALSDQVNDEISRQIYDELDKQLDAQMMSELEKCHDEQSRLMDEELDRQLQEQLDAMLEASLGNELRGDEQDEYEYYSEDDDRYSSGEEDEFEHLPWSEGGEGGIGSLGLGEHLQEDGDARSKPSAMFGTPRYSEEELQTMLDTLYGEGGGGNLVGPGAWGKGRWRPEGDASDST